MTKKGYTLIEILVGLTIIGLIFSFGFVSFREFSRRQALQGAGKTMIGDLRLAQQMANSGEKPDDIGCQSPNILNGYNFRVNSTSNYTVEAVCNGTTLVEIKSVDLPTDISTSTPSTNPVFFKVIGQGNNLTAGNPARFTLSQTGSTTTFSFTVSASGRIQ